MTASAVPAPRIVVEPYTLLVYKKGLYLVAFSVHHQSRRTFALDGFREVECLKNDRFEYPAECHPEQGDGRRRSSRCPSEC
jgi:predicted DNA-binding transcriptional regulator YafY